MNTTYPSKISYTLLSVVFLVFYVPIAIQFYNNGITLQLMLITLGVTLVFGAILYMFFSLKYVITSSTLLVKYGVFTSQRIPVSVITKISKSTNIVASPAASFDRIELKYGKFEELIISPKHKIAFVKQLLALNPSIKSTII